MSLIETGAGTPLKVFLNVVDLLLETPKGSSRLSRQLRGYEKRSFRRCVVLCDAMAIVTAIAMDNAPQYRPLWQLQRRMFQ